MTTGARITISEHSVRAALAEWHGQHRRRPEPERAAAHEQVEAFDAGRYADHNAAFLFELLRKHAEAA